MAISPSVTVAVVPRDRYHLTAQTVDRIFANTQIPFNLVLVNAGCPDVFWTPVEEKIHGRDNVRVVNDVRCLSTNAASNLVLDSCDTDYLCLIENDVLVEPGWLTALITACQEHPADVASPLILESRCGATMVHFDDRLGCLQALPAEHPTAFRIKPRHPRKELARRVKRLQVHFTEMHCNLYRREALEKIAPLDPEQSSRAEIDLSMSLYTAGLTLVLEPRSRVRFFPPPPILPEERARFVAYWDLERARRNHRELEQRWSLEACPSSMDFAASRRALAEIEDPEEQIRNYEAFWQHAANARVEIDKFLPEGASLILVDEAQWNVSLVGAGRVVFPFLEKDGSFWGAPADDTTAIRELERLRTAGAQAIVFAEPAFWWLKFYEHFAAYLERNYVLVSRSESIVAFDLRSR